MSSNTQRHPQPATTAVEQASTSSPMSPSITSQSSDSSPSMTTCRSSFPENQTAVVTPAQFSEASTRVNSLDFSLAHDKLLKLHEQIEKGDSTAIAEYEKLAHIHQLPPHEHLKSHLHFQHRHKSHDADDAESGANAQDGGALEEGLRSEHASGGAEKMGNEQERLPAVMLTEDEDPIHWSVRRKCTITALVSFLYFNSTITSSVGTGATLQYIAQFGISQEVAALVLSVYMIGFCIGPPLWAPVSELYGRCIVNYISVLGYFLFNIGCALAHNIQTLLVCRFFVGLFAAAPQSNSGGTISDIWLPRVRLWPMFTYSLAAFTGPTLGPLVGGFHLPGPCIVRLGAGPMDSVSHLRKRNVRKDKPNILASDK